VAIKILDPQLAKDEGALERFQREADSAKRLEHDNIVRVLHVGSWRGKYYLVMELLRGGSFRELLRKDDPPEALLAVLGDVARGLAFAHDSGVIHRDVKPENILLTRSRKAKVADFGLARADDLTTLTTDGRVLGTPIYMSPEQARGQRATAASDVYAVGMLIFEVAAGERPFSSDTTHGYLYQHVEQEPPTPRVRSPYPPSLGQLALRCLVKDPMKRPSMAEVAARLDEIAIVAPRRIPWVAVSAIAVALLCIAAVAFPRMFDPLCGPWFGAGLFRALRAAAQHAHDWLL
jgi:serine/threonine-protein kinase